MADAFARVDGSTPTGGARDATQLTFGTAQGSYKKNAARTVEFSGLYATGVSIRRLRTGIRRGRRVGTR